jgi:chromatin remodeling complex protein RSC6
MSAKSVSKKSVKSLKTPVEEPMVVAPVVVPETPIEISEEPIVEASGASILESIKISLEKYASIRKEIREAELNLRNLRVLYKEEIKSNKSLKKRRRRDSGEKQKISHGFQKPTLISDVLAEFLGLPKGSLLTRHEAIKQIAAYINKHELYGMLPDKNGEMKINKTIIKPDAKLAKVIGKVDVLLSKKRPELGVGISYFNFNTYMKRQGHFIKEEPTATA